MDLTKTLPAFALVAMTAAAAITAQAEAPSNTPNPACSMRNGELQRFDGNTYRFDSKTGSIFQKNCITGTEKEINCREAFERKAILEDNIRDINKQLNLKKDWIFGGFPYFSVTPDEGKAIRDWDQEELNSLYRAINDASASPSWSSFHRTCPAVS